MSCPHLVPHAAHYYIEPNRAQSVTTFCDGVPDEPIPAPPFIPHRGDEVDAFIEAWRSSYVDDIGPGTHVYMTLTRMVEEYHRLAAQGLPLDQVFIPPR